MHPNLIRGDGIGDIAISGHTLNISSGYTALNEELQGGGWLRPGLTEILCNHTGIGEISLLAKALAAPLDQGAHAGALHVLWVLSSSQAWIPYAPALAAYGVSLEDLSIVKATSVMDALWAAEQGLKSGACRCVVLQINEARCSLVSMQRLQQSAIAGSSCGFLLRPVEAAESPSLASTRILLKPGNDGELQLTLLKRRGLPPGKTIRLRTRSLACLSREPVPCKVLHVIAAWQAATPPSDSRPEWLAQMLAAATSEQVRPRLRSLDPNRR